MNAIEWFQAQKLALYRAEEWAALVGKRYEGGGGGYGEVRPPVVTMTVYHQPYDGATNYHEAPKEMRKCIEQVVLRDSARIIAGALGIMRERVALAAKKATREAEDVLAEVARAALGEEKK